MPAERSSLAAPSWPHVSAGCCTPQDPCRCSGDQLQPLFQQPRLQPVPRSPMPPIPHPFPPVGPRHHIASSGPPTSAGQQAGYAARGPVSTMHPLQQQQVAFPPHRQYIDGTQLPLQYARDPALQLVPLPATPAAGAMRPSSLPVVSLPPPAMINLQQGACYLPYQQQRLQQGGPGWAAGPSFSVGGDRSPPAAAAAAPVVKHSPSQDVIMSDAPKRGAAGRAATRAAKAAAAATAAAAAAGGGSDASDSKGEGAAAPKRGRARKMTDRERYDIAVTELEARKASLLQLVGNLELSNAGLRRLEAKQAQQLAARDTAISRLWLLQEQTASQAAVSLQQQQQGVEDGPAAACFGSSGGSMSFPGSCVVLLQAPLAPGLVALLARVQQPALREPLTTSQLLGKLCGVGPTLLEAAGGNVVTGLMTHLEEQQVKARKASAVAAAITGACTTPSSSAPGEHARAEAAGYVLQLWQQLVRALAAASVAAAGVGAVPSRDQQQILVVTQALLWHLVTSEASLVLRVMSAGRQPSGQQVLSAADPLPAGAVKAVSAAAAAATAAAAAGAGSPASSVQEASEGGTDEFSCFAVPSSPARPTAAAADSSSFTGPAACGSAGMGQPQGATVLPLLAGAGGRGGAAWLLPAGDEDMLLDQFLGDLLDGAAVELAADERWRETFLGELASETSSVWGPRSNSDIFSGMPMLQAAQAAPKASPAGAGFNLDAPTSLVHPVLSAMHLTTAQTQALAQYHKNATGHQKQQQQPDVTSSHQQAASWLQACSTSSMWSPLADVLEGAADPVSALLGGEAAQLGGLLWAWLGPQSPLSPAQQTSCLAHTYPGFPDIPTLSEALQAHHQAPQPSHANISNVLHG